MPPTTRLTTIRICLVGSVCDEEEVTNTAESQIEVLGTNAQVRYPDPGSHEY